MVMPPLLPPRRCRTGNCLLWADDLRREVRKPGDGAAPTRKCDVDRVRGDTPASIAVNWAFVIRGGHEESSG
ncbi:hypothetical protein Pd630_LPD05657 [Rhodococcus opacus PD630]|nr:hypothetical protein Pd630_LPD05657 [Rhodococcus opacus PD630]